MEREWGSGQTTKIRAERPCACRGRETAEHHKIMIKCTGKNKTKSTRSECGHDY